MRTYTAAGITIKYPNSFVYAGNRNIVKIEGATTKSTFTIFSDTRDLIDGVGEFDLNPYLLDLFVNKGKNEKFTFETVLSLDLIFDSDPVFLEMDFEQIFLGRNIINQSYNLPLTAEYSSYAPFFDFYLDVAKEGTINGVPYSFPAGYNSLDLSVYTGDVVISLTLGRTSTFDFTFDFTFFRTLRTPIVISRVECANEGQIIRWLDNFGVWQQKNFDDVSRNAGASAQIFNWQNQSETVLYNGLQWTQKKQRNTLQVRADGCSYLEALRLQSLCTSSFVHIYDFASGVWLPCVIATNEIPVPKNKNNQSLTFEIITQNEY